MTDKCFTLNLDPKLTQRKEDKATRPRPGYYQSEFIKELRKALGVPELWRRIIIDIHYDDITTVYVEMLADENKLKVLPINVEGMKIVMSKDAD